MAESGNEKTMVVLGLGLDPHTGTTCEAISLEESLVIHTNIHLITIDLHEAKVEGVLLGLVLDMSGRGALR